LMELKDETLSATGASALLARMDGGRRFARIGIRMGDGCEGAQRWRVRACESESEVKRLAMPLGRRCWWERQWWWQWWCWRREWVMAMEVSAARVWAVGYGCRGG
jgi:hypothetical protein